MSVEVLDKPIETKSGEIDLSIHAVRRSPNGRLIAHENGASNELYFASITSQVVERPRAYYTFGFGIEESAHRTESTKISAVIDHEAVFTKSVDRRMFLDLLPKPFYEKRKERAESAAEKVMRDRIGSFAVAYGGVISSEQSREDRSHTPAEQPVSLHS